MNRAPLQSHNGDVRSTCSAHVSKQSTQSCPQHASVTPPQRHSTIAVHGNMSSRSQSARAWPAQPRSCALPCLSTCPPPPHTLLNQEQHVKLCCPQRSTPLSLSPALNHACRLIPDRHSQSRHHSCLLLTAAQHLLCTWQTSLCVRRTKHCVRLLHAAATQRCARSVINIPNFASCEMVIMPQSSHV